jgi:hypothetical protein
MVFNTPQSAAIAAESVARAGSNRPRQQEDDDHNAHAGAVDCAKCWRPILAAQGARRRADTGDWVHQACPGVAD